MAALNQIFEYPLSTHVFVIGTILLALLAICAVEFIRAYTQRDRVRIRSRLIVSTLGALIAVAALVGGFKAMDRASGGDVRQATSVSVGELMQQIDVRSLPAQQVGSLY